MPTDVAIAQSPGDSPAEQFQNSTSSTLNPSTSPSRLSPALASLASLDGADARTVLLPVEWLKDINLVDTPGVKC